MIDHIFSWRCFYLRLVDFSRFFFVLPLATVVTCRMVVVRPTSSSMSSSRLSFVLLVHILCAFISFRCVFVRRRANSCSSVCVCVCCVLMCPRRRYIKFSLSCISIARSNFVATWMSFELLDGCQYILWMGSTCILRKRCSTFVSWKSFREQKFNWFLLDRLH